MCGKKNDKDKNKTIIALKIGICVLVVLNIAIFLYFYCHSETILIKSESLVLTIVGILAAFVVISNYAQILNIKNDTNENIKNMEKETETKTKNVKIEIEKELEIINKRLKVIENHIFPPPDNKNEKYFNEFKVKLSEITNTDIYKKINIINKYYPKLYREVEFNIETLKLILPLLNSTNDYYLNYEINKFIYSNIFKLFVLKVPENIQDLLPIIFIYYQKNTNTIIENNYKEIMLHEILWGVNRLFYHINKNNLYISFNFYDNITNVSNNKNYGILTDFHKSKLGDDYKFRLYPEELKEKLGKQFNETEDYLNPVRKKHDYNTSYIIV
ncbi:MAG: hypothetical protein WBH98_08285 [Bacteroidales bacterium]